METAQGILLQGVNCMLIRLLSKIRRTQSIQQFRRRALARISTAHLSFAHAFAADISYDDLMASDKPECTLSLNLEVRSGGYHTALLVFGNV